jgi:purine-binding chemotaxis protein CheW
VIGRAREGVRPSFAALNVGVSAVDYGRADLNGGPMPETELTRQLVVFSLGDEEYALPITRVQEIIRYTEPRAIASETPWMRGVISLRGKILPVCDLAARMQLESERSEQAKIVIIETATGAAGVIVDDVAEVLTVDERQLDAVPAAGGDLIEAIAKLGDRLVILLDTDGVFGGAELAA